ncbi:MAG: Flagellar sensor histidine kinase FleS [Myxococcaceae bacterium]|nr:Flagellar sensor histidine kinase FleS [Myxococcaceae bacterium]
MSLLAAIGHLSLAVTALVSGRRSALARPLAALCFVLFGWNFSTLAHHVLGAPAFSVLDSAFTALSPPLVLEVVLRFVGQARRQRTARVLVWLAFGGLAAASLLGLVSSAVAAWTDSAGWAAVFLAGWVPTLLFEMFVLVRHLRGASDLAEKARTRTVLAALAIGATFSKSDVARDLGLPLPYLGSIGTLIAAALLTTCAVRFALFDRNVSTRTTVYVLGMIGAFVVAYLVLFRVFAGSLAAQAFVSAVVTLLVVAVARELGIALAESRERVQRLAVLGRFSAQMAHDLRSPLTALLGAVQVLEGTGPGEGEIATRKEFLDLAVAQARRISAIVDRYDRMGRIEPRLTVVRVNEIARAVARAHALPEASLRLDAADPECEADRDLLESAVENVVRNAVEASTSAADVTIETLEEPTALVVRVSDRGAGMDARQRERAFEDFFTTKPTGSGLGLAFTKRVMVAHGGDVALESEAGRGTVVELRLRRG